MIRLLLSARDPSAARNQIALYEAIIQSGRFSVTVAASEPAVTMFGDAGIRVDEIVPEIIGEGEKAQEPELLQRAKRILTAYSPDLLICGLSGPKSGIDEALIHVAKGRVPSYMLQDFWGESNRCFGTLADTFFVIDSVAAEETEAKLGVRSVVSGMPKYDRYAAFLDEQGREEQAREITFFGQPLWDFSGYAVTLEAFLLSAGRAGINEVCYRSHPSEARDDFERVRKMGERAGVTVRHDGEPSPEITMLKSRAIFSLFSLTCFDYVTLSSFRERPLGVACYLLFDGEIRSAFKDETSSSYFTKVFPKLGIIVNAEEELDACWSRITEPSCIEAYYQNRRHLAGKRGSSCERIIQTILEDFR